MRGAVSRKRTQGQCHCRISIEQKLKEAILLGRKPPRKFLIPPQNLVAQIRSLIENSIELLLEQVQIECFYGLAVIIKIHVHHE